VIVCVRTGMSSRGRRLAIEIYRDRTPSMILKCISSPFGTLALPSSSVRSVHASRPLSLPAHPASLVEASAGFHRSPLLLSAKFSKVSCTHSTHPHSALAVAAEVSRQGTAKQRSPSRSHHRLSSSTLARFTVTCSCVPQARTCVTPRLLHGFAANVDRRRPVAHPYQTE